MPIYTFYCCRPDGLAPSFDAADLAGHAEAARHAELLLDRHVSCSHVEVRQGDDVILTCARETEGV